MLTPQELQEKKFTKAVFGGYDMREVDDFLDSIGADYDRLYKENAILKGKLKTLADKVEEYRASDDDMRRTFAEAKRAAEAVIASSKEESEKLLAQAREKCADMEQQARGESEKKLGDITESIAAERRRLERAKEQTLAYIKIAAQACRTQLEALRALGEGAAPSEPKTQEPAAPAAADEPTRAFSMPLSAKEPSSDSAASAPGAESRSDTAEFDAQAVVAASRAPVETPKIISQSVTPIDSVENGNRQDFFQSAREVNIGGRNVKVFETNSKNVFKDIFSDDSPDE